MGVVSREEQDKRETGMAVFMISVLMAIPLIGWLVGLYVASLIFSQIFKKSSTRLVDLGLLFLFVIAYVLAVFAPVLLLGEKAGFVPTLVAMCIATFVVSYFFINVLQRRSDIMRD
jgi:hypothetical protein